MVCTHITIRYKQCLKLVRTFLQVKIAYIFYYKYVRPKLVCLNMSDQCPGNVKLSHIFTTPVIDKNYTNSVRKSTYLSKDGLAIGGQWNNCHMIFTT